MAAPDARPEEPAVSVIVATRNRAVYLRDCLESVAGQRSASPFEVVVVDNGSSDETPRVLDEWTRRDSRFRSITEPVAGQSRAKNAGIAAARGRLLLFTDDDAIVQPGWIDAYFRLPRATEGDLVLAGGPVVPVPEDLGGWPEWFDRAHLPDLGLLDLGEERELHHFEYVWGGNMAVPASTFERLGGWDESVGHRGDERGTFEDSEFEDRIRRAGGAVWFCPGAVVHHRLPRERITPRNVVGTAFARGRNDFAQESLYGASGRQRRGEASMARLGANLGAWLWWSARFRRSNARRDLERARRAAWETGWTLDALRSGRPAMLLSRAAGRAAFGVRGAALRLIPDRS